MNTEIFKGRVAVTAQIVAFGLLSLVLAFLLMLELFSAPDAALELKTPITTSSSSLTAYNSTNKRYRTQVAGELINRSDDTLRMDRIEAVISDGTREKTVVLAEQVEILPRVSRELFLEWEDEWEYDRVIAVRSVTGERVEELHNAAPAPAVGGILLYGVLLAVCVLLLIHGVKQRYYLWQEMAQRKA